MLPSGFNPNGRGIFPTQNKAKKIFRESAYNNIRYKKKPFFPPPHLFFFPEKKELPSIFKNQQVNPSLFCYRCIAIFFYLYFGLHIIILQCVP